MPNYNKLFRTAVRRNSFAVPAAFLRGALISASLILGGANSADAQIQRSFINLSFEQPQLSPDNCWAIRLAEAQKDILPADPQLQANLVPGWRTTEPGQGVRGSGCSYSIPLSTIGLLPEFTAIQIFRNFQGVAAHGDQWAELNAFSASRLYQNVCLLEGDEVQWALHHKGRNGTETFKFNISPVPHAPLAGTQIIVEGTSTTGGAGTAANCLENCSVEQIGTWAKYQGSFTWNQPSGEQTIGFEAITGGTSGNFLDAISIVGLVPFVEFQTTDERGIEGEHNAANFPGHILVSGHIPEGQTLDVVVKLTDITTSPADYSNDAEIIVSIPSGDYASQAFRIPIEILSDAELEPEESFQLSLEDRPGIYRLANTRKCGDPAINETLTYTILDTGVTFVKEGVFVDVAGGTGADGQPLKEAGDRIDYTFTLTNGGGADLGDIVVTDSIIGTPELDAAASDISPDGRLASGGAAVYRASYTITQEDVDRGEVTNVAELTATTPDFPDQPPVTASDTHTELLPPFASLSLVKTGAMDPETDNGNGLPDPGERLHYEITITNDGNVTALNVRPNDPGPTFNGAAAAGTMSPFSPESATMAPGEQQLFTAFYTLTEQDIARGSGMTDGVANTASVSAETPSGELVTADLPEPATITLPGYAVEKRAEVTQVQRGSRVPYVITVKPLGLEQPSRVRLADITPPGFIYMPGTATVDGVLIEPVAEGKRLTWELDVVPEQDIEVRIMLGVSAATRPGTYTNTAQAERLDNGMVFKPVGRADVEIIPEPVFDCGDILGKVFIDRNRNGYQDQGETGLAGARVTSVDGMRMTTDQHGRFHVACADMPNPRIGSSFIMKLDPRSLPTGSRIISENPRVVRLTAGKTSEISFATAIGRVVRLDLSNEAFLEGSTSLAPLWQQSIASLVLTLETEPSILRIVYRDTSGDRGLANQRLKQLRNMVSQQWKEGANRYRLEIEARVEIGRPALAERN